MDRPEQDAALIGRYLGGEMAALDALIEHYRRPVYAYIINMTGSAAEADDIFQEVWLRVLKNLERYEKKNFYGWLVRIAHNLVVDRARRQRPQISLEAGSEDDGMALHERLDSGQPDPAAHAAAGDLGVRVAQAVASLPDDQREVFLMRTEMDMPFKEIAAVQNVSINTALARMQYALAKLRPLLQMEYEALA